MKYRLYARLDKFYKKTMKNHKIKENEDEELSMDQASSMEQSFNDPVPQSHVKPSNDLVTSIIYLDE
jgi:hypothetical protein|tara:strand:+ start:206 stop:406 length:201 start_codon:yes stop_codon:yes gene_type:complete